METEMETTRSTWHSSRISCGRMPMLNAFCGTHTKRAPLHSSHPALAPASAPWLIQHTHSQCALWVFFFFCQHRSYPSIQASIQRAIHPSVGALEAIIISSITFLGCHDSWLRLNFDWQYRKHLKCLFPASLSLYHTLSLSSLSLPTWQSDF